MKVIKIKYPFFVFAINKMQNNKIVAHRMVEVAEVPCLFKAAHPRCAFEVVHGSQLEERHLDYLASFKIS